MQFHMSDPLWLGDTMRYRIARAFFVEGLLNLMPEMLLEA